MPQVAPFQTRERGHGCPRRAAEGQGPHALSIRRKAHGVSRSEHRDEGFARAAEAVQATGADLLLLSPDDMAYRPGWFATLVRFWRSAPRAVQVGARSGQRVLSRSPDAQQRLELGYKQLQQGQEF